MQILKGVTRAEYPNFLKQKGYKVGVEVGVQGGAHAAQILKGWDGKLFLVDAWMQYDKDHYVDLANVPDHEQHAYYNLCLENIRPFGERAVIIRKLSADAVKYFENGSLDFVYIDANHSYFYITEDLRNWYLKLRSGGMMSGHDYTQDNDDPTLGCFGVKAAVNEFVKRNQISNLFVAEEDWPNWIFFKR
jgi:hypothetical protein